MKKLFFIIFLFTLTQLSYSQTIEKTLDRSYAHYDKNHQEKLYLHLDKYSYTAGETIWFKAYLTLGIQNLFSRLSNVGYIEVIDPTNKIVDSLTFPLINGLAIGDITLADTLTEGSYRIRAYTNWMRNFGPDYFYDRTLSITNGRSDNVQTLSQVSRTEKEDVYTITLKTLSGIPISKTSVRYELIKDGKVLSRKRTSTDEQGIIKIGLDQKEQGAIIQLSFSNLEKLAVKKIIKPIDPASENKAQLFPEGGKLLKGHLNNIAVKTLTPKGLGIKAKITVMSGVDTAAVFDTNELGMGASFIFVDEHAKLSASATFEDKSSTNIEIPTPVDEGYSMAVNFSRNRLMCQINISDNLINDKELYFVLHHLGRPIYVAKQKASKNELVFATNNAEIPTGVLTITVLNDQFLPVMERPIFNHSLFSRLPLSITLNKPIYGKRDKVNVSLETGTEQDSLKVAALSASVLNLSKLKDTITSAPNILTQLLLSNDLKGYIERPGYYFERDSVKLKDLDYLMLTQGWRTIDWTKLQEDSVLAFKAENGITISGYTKKYGRKAAEPNARVQLISTKSYMDYIDTTSNEDGYFEINQLLFPDSVKFIISARTDKDKKNIDIVYNTKRAPIIGKNPNAPNELNDLNSQYLDQIKDTKQFFAQMESKGMMEKVIALEEVVVRATSRPKASPNSNNLNGPGNADQVITAEDLSTCPTLEICLAGRLMGVYWQAGVPYNTRGNVPMQVVLDGMFIEAEQISMVNVMDIESVEVLRNVNYTAIYGMNGGNGLIIITSKTGASAMNNYIPKGILTIQPQGIRAPKTFYKPAYDLSESVKLAQDLRTTIHWEPGIVSGLDGKTSFDFFTSDQSGRYIMIIEGIDLSGRIVHKIKEFEVK